VDKKFLIDFMLGKLCKWLRILGYDAVYFKETGRQDVLYKSLLEKRILLTRDHTLSAKRAWKLILIENDFLENQIKQLVNNKIIEIVPEKFFSRCSICNVLIENVQKEFVKGKVPEYIYQTHSNFSYCFKCKRIYWPGTHLELFEKKLKNLLN